jgi:transposase
MLSAAGYSVKCINSLITKQYQRLSMRDAKSDTVDALRLAQIGELEPNLFSFEATLATIVRKKQVMFLTKLERTKQSLSRQVAHKQETAAQLGFSVALSHAEEAIASIERQRKQLVSEIERTADDRTIKLADGISGVSREKAAILDTLLADRMFTNKKSTGRILWPQCMREAQRHVEGQRASFEAWQLGAAQGALCYRLGAGAQRS